MASAMHRDIPSVRAAHMASAWALLFGAMHVVWALAYFYWPTIGRVTLGPDFEWAFGRPWFMAYDLVVAGLFVVAAALAVAMVRPWGARVPRWMLVPGVWTAAMLLFLRGAVGVVMDLLVMLGAVHRAPSPPMFYDFWFVLGGILFGAVAWQQRRRATVAGSSAP